MPASTTLLRCDVKSYPLPGNEFGIPPVPGKPENHRLKSDILMGYVYIYIKIYIYISSWGGIVFSKDSCDISLSNLVGLKMEHV